jgi:hypothetical protein
VIDHQQGHRGHADFVAADAKQVSELTESEERHTVCNTSAIVEERGSTASASHVAHD